MNDYKQRVKNEKAELDERKSKLDAFLGSEFIENVATDEQERLKRQLVVMEEYSSILQERIEAFEEE